MRVPLAYPDLLQRRQILVVVAHLTAIIRTRKQKTERVAADFVSRCVQIALFEASNLVLCKIESLRVALYASAITRQAQR